MLDWAAQVAPGTPVCSAAESSVNRMRALSVRGALTGVLVVLIAALLVAAGFLARYAVEPDRSSAPSAQTAGLKAPAAAAGLDFSVFPEILGIIQKQYVDPDKVDLEALYNGAIDGIFKALNDPHSTYIDPKTYAVGKDDFSGAFSGIGATVSRQNDNIVIVQPIPNTPAERAGLKGGDVLLEVDGHKATGWTVEEAVLKIRGPSGTSVTLKVRHGDGKEETLVIVRGQILVASVDTTPPGGTLRDASGAEAKDLAYIRIRSFTQRTPDELRKELEAAKQRGVKGLILDLRGNPGGLLMETAQVADMFLDKGVMLVQQDRGGQEHEFTARPGTVTDLPVVIVQDEFSASGSEVLAAALRDNDRAKIVGTRSFGKGTVNTAVELRNGGAIYISIAHWLTPKRDQIEARGVKPDFEVQLTPEDIQRQRDVSVYKAIDVLRQQTR